MFSNGSYSTVLLFVCAALGLAIPVTAFAETYRDIEFPHGEKSFAESVVSFELHDDDVGEEYADPEQTLGPPDHGDQEDPKPYIALGNAEDEDDAGELIIAFDSNRLIDVEGDDLYIFEIGPQVEATDVAISIDNEEWYELGRIEGSTRGVDLADYPEVPERRGFRYVRLRDHPDGNTSDSPYAGPDIDAIGAIGSVDAEEITEDGRFASDVESDGCVCANTRGNGGSMLLFVLAMVGLVGIRRLT